MKQINFSTTKEETLLISDILKRAHKLNPNTFKHMDLFMDITACHCNGTPLDFQNFLNFDDFNFNHDVFGINNNLNRSTGELINCFLPRCSK